MSPTNKDLQKTLLHNLHFLHKIFHMETKSKEALASGKFANRKRIKLSEVVTFTKYQKEY